jgi:hypothetical protein
MKHNIEDTMCDEALPVNTIAMANRLIEILQENNCNNVPSIKDRKEELKKFKKCLWLINSQTYGQLEILNMMDEWSDLCGG